MTYPLNIYSPSLIKIVPKVSQLKSLQEDFKIFSHQMNVLLSL